MFVVTAVESLDDLILEKLQKGHSREDFFRVVELFRQTGLNLQPTFVPFTPWTTFENYLDLLEQVLRLDLVEAIAPIQLAIRLLIPPGSLLLELDEVQQIVGPFDQTALIYPWKNSTSGLDGLASILQETVADSEKLKRTRSATFERIYRKASLAAGREAKEEQMPVLASRATVPYLNEPWYC